MQHSLICQAAEERKMHEMELRASVASKVEQRRELENERKKVEAMLENQTAKRREMTERFHRATARYNQVLTMLKPCNNHWL